MKAGLLCQGFSSSGCTWRSNEQLKLLGTAQEWKERAGHHLFLRMGNDDLPCVPTLHTMVASCIPLLVHPAQSELCRRIPEQEDALYQQQLRVTQEIRLQGGVARGVPKLP